MANKKVKFVVAGYGHIGKRHAELIMQHPQAELVGIIDVIANPASILDIPYYTNLSDFLTADKEAHVVNICTPNGLHATQAVECLSHQKNVVIEKPIALSKADAQAIQKTSKQSNKYVFPVVQNRYSPTIKWLKEIIGNKRLGKVFMVQLNCFWNRDERYYTSNSWHGTLKLDGGPLYTQFSHFIDVLLWIFGDITHIQAKFSDYNHQHCTEFEDSGVVLFDFVKGGSGIINYSTSVYQSNMESSIIVIGEKGTVKIGGQYMNNIVYCNVDGLEQPFLESPLANNYGLYAGSASNHQFVIDNVVEVLTNGTKPNVTLQDGVDVVDVIERIYANRTNDKILRVTNRNHHDFSDHQLFPILHRENNE